MYTRATTAGRKHGGALSGRPGRPGKTTTSHSSVIYIYMEVGQWKHALDPSELQLVRYGDDRPSSGYLSSFGSLDRIYIHTLTLVGGSYSKRRNAHQK
jgi:hypothetical protein